MKTILVPTDFSANSLKAFKFAISTALSNKAKIVVMHQTSVLELAPESAFTGLYIPSPIDQVSYLKKELDKFIKKALRSFNSKTDGSFISSEIIPGVGTIDIILQTAKRHKADLIILGSTGASGLKRLFIGSVAAKVIEHSPIPVIVIPDSFRNKAIKNIGYASDLAHVSDELTKILPIAEALGSKVEIFHVEPTFPTSEAFKKFDAEKNMAEWKKKFKLDSLTYKMVRTKFDNDFYTGVDKYRRNSKPDMICMVTHRRNWVSKILDPSKSKGIAYHNEIPVLCIKG
ncbi:MAG TPA: universal stress protein [Flavobacteriales bacterium]|nr:universal stress protein [Flavobacteriales bacterium]